MTDVWVPDNWRWRAGPVAPGPAVVFDIDGVLSDAVAPPALPRAPVRDWEAFFHACGDDDLIDEVARLLELLDPDLRVVLLTARPSGSSDQTLAWLAALRAALGPARHAATGATTARPGLQAARRSGSSATYGFDLRLAFEDDRRNVDMFRAEGVPCVYIHSGYYD